MKTILQLCADTGSDTKPYKDAGYEVILIGKDIGVENYHPDRPIHGIIANPVCTEFSTARSDGKARNPKEGMMLVRECQRIIKEAGPWWWVIENPAKGVLKDFLGPPQYEYEPWWYGSPWTKRTALWGKFNTPPDCTRSGRMYRNSRDCTSVQGEGSRLLLSCTSLTTSRYRSFKPYQYQRAIWNFVRSVLRSSLRLSLKLTLRVPRITGIVLMPVAERPSSA